MKKEFSVLLLFGIIFVLSLSYVSAYEIYYYHTDNSGSPVAITDENASVVWSADYEPFGKSFNELVPKKTAREIILIIIIQKKKIILDYFITERDTTILT